MHRLAAAAIIGHETARLAHQQAACGGIPRLQVGFPEAVEASAGRVAEVQRRRAVAAYRLEEARMRKEHSEITAELETLYEQVKTGKITGKNLSDMQDRIRELEQSLALDLELDD